MASQITVHRGGTPFTQGKKFPLEGQMPSLKYYEHMTELLPPHLASELMDAAKDESREYAKKGYPTLHIQKENHAEAKRVLEYVVDKVNRYLLTGDENVAPRETGVSIPVGGKSTIDKDEDLREYANKRYVSYGDEVFD
jgi:hypothetical protein